MKRRKPAKALLLDPAFRYNNAEASQAPGYLAKRMALYARKAAAKSAVPAANVLTIPQKKKPAS